MALPRALLHTAWLLLDLLVAVGCVELLLRHDLEGSGQRRAARPAGARPEVLFLGDSHFFGLWVDGDHTAPALAERFSVECDPKGFDALNHARGGATTWHLVDVLPGLLRDRRPRALVVRAGIANRLQLDPERAPLWQRLYVTSLAEGAWRELDRWVRSGADPEDAFGLGLLREEQSPSDRSNANLDPRAAVAFRGSGRAASQDYERDVSPGVRRGLARIAREARAARIPTIFVSYLLPGDLLARVSDDLSAVAREEGVPFVDLRPLAARAVTELDRGDILLHDGHPTALGYALEGREIDRALVEAGVLAGPQLSDSLAWLRAQPRAETPEAVRAEASVARAPGAVLAFEVRGRAGGSGTLYVGAPAPGVQFCTVRLPIRAEDVAACAAEPALRFRLDEGGRARVEVPAPLAARLPESGIAIALVFGRETPTPSLALSPAVPCGTAPR